ncbi:MAG TPA: class I SAM-dependent methyltransferase [Methylomirabilota bacterium]|nr:class I SAM-dependent methyltransferase [Methylomirabilota bacterium]
MSFADAKQRFSNRVADYVRYRPGYPPEVLDVLRAECGLRPGHVIADIGSGTGFLSELFLKNGNRVYGVEPNQEMRLAGEEYLAAYDGFSSIEGSAESTTLEDASIDYVTAGQAFHWFAPEATRREFQRVLRPTGWVVVLWNERLTDASPFLRDYEAFLQQFGTDYSRVNESYPREEQMRDFFQLNAYRQQRLANFQEFDFEGLAGRVRSSSYMPASDHPSYAPMIADLERIFRAHRQNGSVRIEYLTHLYYGRLQAGTGA